MIRKIEISDSQRLGIIRILILIFFFMNLTSCSNEVKETLVANNSTWVFSKQDFNNPQSLSTAKLMFKNNGYVFETETILYYPYSYFSGTLTINNQEFEVLSIKDDLIVLRNKKYGTIAKLSKVKD